MKPLVLHVVPDADPYGINNSVDRLSRHIKSYRHARVALFEGGLGQGHKVDSPYLAAGAVREIALVSCAIRLRHFVRCVRPDLLHLHGFLAMAVGAVVGKLTRIPYIGHIRGTVQRPVLNKFFCRVLYRHAPIIACSESAAEDFRAAVGIQPLIVPNGVDVPLVRQHAIDKMTLIHDIGLRGSVELIGFVGRVEYEKNVPFLLDAFAIVRRSRSSAHLVIVGDGCDLKAMEEESHRRGLADNVHFLGFRPDAQALLGGFDVVVMPSRWEGLSLAVLEAMAQAKPVVATRVTGNVSAVEDGVTGFLVTPGDATGMAKAICCLLENPALRRQMGSAGRARVIRNFSAVEEGSRIEDIYDKVLSRASTPTGTVDNAAPGTLDE